MGCVSVSMDAGGATSRDCTNLALPGQTRHLALVPLESVCRSCGIARAGLGYNGCQANACVTSVQRPNKIELSGMPNDCTAPDR